MQSFKSFADLANHMTASERSRDIAAAKRLRKARSLPGPKVGPKVAR
jgi:hypothetical protein